MATKIDFNICPIDCETFKFTDITCLHKPNNPYYCTDGYNVPGNIDVYDVDSTLFNFVFPNGTTYTDKDIQYSVGRKARIEVQMTGYVSGFISILLGTENLGAPVMTVDIETSVQTIISTINGGASTHGWTAYLKDGTTDTFIIESQEYGSTYNNQQLDIIKSDPGITFDLFGIGANSDLTYGANGFTNEYCFGMAEILGIECSEQDLPCGVYKVTYRLIDDGSNEIIRKTKFVLNDNCLRKALKKWILLTQNGSCCTVEMDARIFDLRLMHEKAVVQFENCMYDCAQKTIDKALKYMNNICLDC